MTEKEKSNFIKVTNAYVIRMSSINMQTGRPADVIVANFVEPELFPFGLQMKISRRLQAVRDEAKVYEEHRVTLTTKYGQKDKNGKTMKYKEGDRIDITGQLVEDNKDTEIGTSLIGQPIPPEIGSKEEKELREKMTELIEAEIDIALPPINLKKWINHKDMPKVSDDIMRLLIPLCEEEED